MRHTSEIQKIGIVGAGLIGISWATVFCAAGRDVGIYDTNPAQRNSAIDRTKANLVSLREAGLLDPATKVGLISVHENLSGAVGGADYVQESVLETVKAKRDAASEIDAAIGPRTLVGSSSSGTPASEFTQELSNRDRFFVVHPVNPPHLIPAVEIVPAPWSDTVHIATLREFMTAVGQEPIVVNREIEGFLVNRLQGALLNEAWALYSEGYASIDDIDRTVRAGLGLRWSLMGPFETIDLNAPGGIVDYAERLQPLYLSVAKARCNPVQWPQDAIHNAAAELATAHAGIERHYSERRRDEWLLELKKAKIELTRSVAAK